MPRRLISVVLALFLVTPLAIAAAQADGPVYLPMLARDPDPTPTPTEPPVPTGCQPAPEEQAIADHMLTHPEQARTSLTCHPILERVARERALDMATRGYESHVNPDGFGPNYLVRLAGYPLSPSYSSVPSANSIEVMYFGYGVSATPNPENPWTWWMNSTIHRTMLLGLDGDNSGLFLAQNEYGVGHVYVPGSHYGHYWIVLTARQ